MCSSFGQHFIICKVLRSKPPTQRILKAAMHSTANRKRPRAGSEINNDADGCSHTYKRRSDLQWEPDMEKSALNIDLELRALRFEALSCLAKRAPSVPSAAASHYQPQPIDSVCTEVSNWIILICRHMRIYRATCHAALSMWRRVMVSVSSKFCVLLAASPFPCVALAGEQHLLKQIRCSRDRQLLHSHCLQATRECFKTRWAGCRLSAIKRAFHMPLIPQEASPPPMSDYYQVLGQPQEMLAAVSDSGLPHLRSWTGPPPKHPSVTSAAHCTDASTAGAAASSGGSALSPVQRRPSTSPSSPCTPDAKRCRGGYIEPPPLAKAPSKAPCRVVLGSLLTSPRDLIPLEAQLLRLLKWRLNDPCAFDWAASLILTAHPTPTGCEPGTVARGLLLRASTVLDLAVLHPWCAQQSELALGAAAVLSAGLPLAHLQPALAAAGVPGLLASAPFAPAQRLVGGCAKVCPPLEGHCLVEAAVAEFHPSEFLWLQSHCEASRSLVATLQ